MNKKLLLVLTLVGAQLHASEKRLEISSGQTTLEIEDDSTAKERNVEANKTKELRKKLQRNGFAEGFLLGATITASIFAIESVVFIAPQVTDQVREIGFLELIFGSAGVKGLQYHREKYLEPQVPAELKKEVKVAFGKEFTLGALCGTFSYGVYKAIQMRLMRQNYGEGGENE